MWCPLDPRDLIFVDFVGSTSSWMPHIIVTFKMYQNDSKCLNGVNLPVSWWILGPQFCLIYPDTTLGLISGSADSSNFEAAKVLLQAGASAFARNCSGQLLSHVGSSCCQAGWLKMNRNKMKPTNPNAHTYDNEPRNHSYERRERKCKAWSVVCRVWSKKCKVWSVKCRVWRIKCGV